MDFTDRVIELATTNVERGGKPFSCLVVRDGEVIAESPNLVAQSNDPTAHAEIVAIRQACQRLGTPSLEGCDVYVTAEPCPMCLGALYYAAPDRVVYLATREQEAELYRDDGRYVQMETFYTEYGLEPGARRLPLEHSPVDGALRPYETWATRQGQSG